MALLRTHPPRPIFRGAILLASFAFLLGVAGIFYFQQRDDLHRPLQGAATVLVNGLEDREPVQVVVEWEPPGPSVVKEREVGERGTEPHTWTFDRAPEGVPVTLLVFCEENGQRRELARHPAILTYGGLFEHFVRPDPPR